MAPADGDEAGARGGAYALVRLLTEEDRHAALERDVAVGLRSTPKRLPSKWHYDDEGSRLFGEITKLPEYYPTCSERSLLERHAPEIVGRAGADTLVELGAGTSEKTRLLLDAMAAAGRLRGIIVLDVDEGTLARSAAHLALEYQAAEVVALVADLDHHRTRLPRQGRRMIAFLGSSIGNYPPAERRAFLRDLRGGMSASETFLVGADLVKDPSRIMAAYDHERGVTSSFSRNVLAVLNRELDADFDLAAFRHVATWDAKNEWVDIRLRSLRAQRVHMAALDLRVDFGKGEEIRTQTSAKFRRETFERELVDAGLSLVGWWEHENGFALALARAT